MSSTVLLKAAGLNTSANLLDRPDGALTEASNVIIKRDGIIEQRRGYKIYGTQLPNALDRVKQLTTYRNRLIRHYADKLQYDSDGAGSFLAFAGSFLETQPGLRMKFIESNGNLYFTTSEGIKKLSARSASDFSMANGYIINAGSIKAVDFTATNVYTPNSQSAWLPQDSAVAYRVVWGYKDINNNLVLGAPSQRVVISSSLLELLNQDYMRLLNTLDSFVNASLTSARINDKNYVATLPLTLNSSASELQTSLISLTTKLDNDILYANQAVTYLGETVPLQMGVGAAVIAGTTCTITFTSGTPSTYFAPGAKILLAGFSPAAGTLNGPQVVVTAGATTITFNTTATGAVTLASATINSNVFRSILPPSLPSIPATNDELVEYQNYIVEILTRLGSLPVSVISVTDQALVTLVDITTTSTVNLPITIPVGIDSNYFFQVYRSSVSQATGVSSFGDLVPSDELQLVYESYPTAAELAALSINFTDITPDAFRGANLYTNDSTGEGILQANDIPPFAKDINRYRNSVFYANTRTSQKLLLSLLGVTQMMADYALGIIPKITISNGTSTNTYTFVVGQQEITEITAVANVADSLDGKYFLLSSVLNDYYVWFSSGAAADPAITGRVGIKVIIPSNQTNIQVALALYNKLSTYLQDFIISAPVGAVNTINSTDVGLVTDAAAGTSGFTINITFQGVGERVTPQITKITTVAATSYVSSGVADYFTISTTLDQKRYYLYFQRGTVTDPALAGYIGIQIPLVGSETTDQVALLIAAALPSTYFTTSVLSNVITVVNTQFGECSSATEVVANAGFLVSVEQIGALEVLLSPNPSPAIAADQTARSFIRVINKNLGDTIYGYYLSSVFDVPGKMLFESRNIQTLDKFYVIGNNDNTGLSFNPDIGPIGTITNISAANPTILTSVAHGLINGEQIMITASDSTPKIDGLYTVTVLSPDTFSIPKVVDIAGTTAVFIKATDSVYSENEEKSNRIYYSKYQQPEAVPISNYFDVGSADKAILRILPLRDSLFVFKEDGLYRISGESAPFQLELFDTSFIVLAPDSVQVCNNVIYAWTTQGIQSLNESGSSIISRSIDNQILKIQSDNYISFKTATWGVGYESDNSYTVYTTINMLDSVATIGYRFSTLTNTWTNIDKTTTCGVINSFDDKMYLGAADVAYIEQERKSFSRLDYADREIASVISSNKMHDNTIILASVTGISVGDVIVQDQTLGITHFNILLNKLDMDSGVIDSDYFSTLGLLTGDSPRVALDFLAQKIDADTGVTGTSFYSTIQNKNGVIIGNTFTDSTIIESTAHGLITGRSVTIDSSNSIPSINGQYIVTVIDPNHFSIPKSVTYPGTTGNWQTNVTNFNDLQASYNFIVNALNTDTGVSFSNYSLITYNTLQESIITAINTITKKITLNVTLQYLVGDITIFKAIESKFTYSPTTMGDPLMLKHIREATLMFENRAFSGGIMSFASDLLPAFQDVPFTLSGNGAFGYIPFGDGSFGGVANSAPFRTYVPRQCQRCRYLLVKFTHKTAREDYRLVGVTLTGEVGKSTRAYR